MEIVVAILLITLLFCSLVTASVTHSTTIGGKQFQKSKDITAPAGTAVETSIPAALVGTMTAQAQSNKTATTGTAWAANVATFTTTAPHGYTVGQVVTVAGASPSGYNGTFAIATVPSSTTFTVALLADPGSWSSGGTITSYNTFTTTATNTLLVSDTIDLYTGTAPATTCRRLATVAKVVGNAVGFTGGTGTVPGNTVVVQVCIPTKLAINFVGANAKAVALYSEGQSQFTFVTSDSATEVANFLFQVTGGYSHIWDTNSPITNPFTGSTVAYLWISHNLTTAAVTARAGVLNS